MPRCADPIDAYLAADHLGISPATIRSWKRRGLIHPVGKDSRRDLFSLAEIAAVEAATRTSGDGRPDLRRTA